MSVLEGHKLAARVEFGTHQGHVAGVGEVKPDSSGSRPSDAGHSSGQERAGEPATESRLPCVAQGRQEGDCQLDWLPRACVLAHPSSSMAYLASDQSLHLCALVSLSVAGDGDAERKDRNTKPVKNASTRKEPAGEG